MFNNDNASGLIVKTLLYRRFSDPQPGWAVMWVMGMNIREVKVAELL
jgi:hypothetical protein